MNNFNTLKEFLLEKKAEIVSKDQIMAYQMKNKGISWAAAKKAVEEPILKARKDALKKAKQDIRRSAPRKPREKYLTTKQFEKKMKDSVSDFVGDAASDLKYSNPDLSKSELISLAREQLDSVAWDMAGSMMYDQDVDKYVRNRISKNTGKSPDAVNSQRVQEYIADYLV